MFVSLALNALAAGFAIKLLSQHERLFTAGASILDLQHWSVTDTIYTLLVTALAVCMINIFALLWSMALGGASIYAMFQGGIGALALASNWRAERYLGGGEKCRGKDY